MNPFRSHMVPDFLDVRNQCDRLSGPVNISIAGTSMEREYGFDHVKLGLVLSAFAWGYALFQAPGSRLTDRSARGKSWRLGRSGGRYPPR
jgi:MFS family permease